MISKTARSNKLHQIVRFLRDEPRLLRSLSRPRGCNASSFICFIFKDGSQKRHRYLVWRRYSICDHRTSDNLCGGAAFPFQVQRRRRQLYAKNLSRFVLNRDRIAVLPDTPNFKRVTVSTMESEDVTPNHTVAQCDIDRLGGSSLLPTDTRHANIRAMHEDKTIPGRWFPKKMKTIRETLRQLLALMPDILRLCRMQFVPDFARETSRLIRTVDPRDKERHRLRSILRFKPRVHRACANDPGKKTQHEQAK